MLWSHWTMLLIISPWNITIAADLNGRHLRMATWEQAPFTIFDRDASGNITGYRGLCFDIVQVLQETFNFTYSLQMARDGITGLKLPNGSWNGLVGMIIDGEIDMAIAALSVTQSRKRVIDYTETFYEEPTGILIPPPTEDSKLSAVLKPFQYQVWIAVILSMIIVPIALWILFLSLRNIKDREPSGTSRCSSLYRHFIFVYAVVIGQSSQRTPSAGHATRVLAAVWCLSSVVLVYVYVGILVSVLSVPKLRPLVHSIEDLPGSSLQFGTRRATSTQALLAGAKEGIFRVIGDEFRKHPQLLTETDEEGVQRVANGSYAFMIGKTYLEVAMALDFQQTGQCRLSLAKEDFYKRNYAFPVAKDSWLPKLFNPKILQMIEVGLTEHWRKKYFPPKNRCTDSKTKEPIRRLNLSDLQSAFLVLAVGTGSALLAFILEWIVYFRSRLIRI